MNDSQNDLQITTIEMSQNDRGISENLTGRTGRPKQYISDSSQGTKTKVGSLDFIRKQSKFFGKEERWQNTEYFLSDYQVEKVTQEYFIYFNFQQFFEFFLYHVLFLIVIGPILNLYTYWSPKHRFLFYNLSFWGQDQYLYQQIGIFISTQTVIMMLLFIPDMRYLINMTQFVSFFTFIVVRCAIISFKYATLVPSNIEIYKSEYLSIEERHLFQTSYWTVQKDAAVIQDITRSIRRYQCDNSIFYFSFFFPLDDHSKGLMREATLKLQQAYKSMRSDLKQKHFVEDFLQQSEENKYFGYTIFYVLLREMKNLVSVRKVQGLAFLLALVRIIIGQIKVVFLKFISQSFRFFINEAVFGSTASETFFVILFNCELFYFEALNYLFFMFGLMDLQIKLNFMIQLCKYILLIKILAYMLQALRNQNAYHQVFKILPTLDLLNPQVIYAWTYLRRLVLEYGLSYQLRYQGIIAIFVTYNIAQLILLLLNTFNVVHLQMDETVLNIYDLSITFIILVNILFFMAAINSHFDHHQQTIIHNKEQADKFLNLKRIFFDQEYQSNNLLYDEIISRVKNTIKNDDEKDELLQNISDSYQHALDTIDYDSLVRPYKLYGIVITQDLIIKIIIGIVSVVPAAVLSQLQSYQADHS